MFGEGWRLCGTWRLLIALLLLPVVSSRLGIAKRSGDAGGLGLVAEGPVEATFFASEGEDSSSGSEPAEAQRALLPSTSGAPSAVEAVAEAGHAVASAARAAADFAGGSAEHLAAAVATRGVGPPGAPAGAADADGGDGDDGAVDSAAEDVEEPCNPRCGWQCGPSPACNEVCEPMCAPPQCRTLCGRHPDACETRCGPPQCAVICPQDMREGCPDGGEACGRCRTVCSPPVCTTECGDDCRNVCETPRCSWKCHLPSCPKPRCQLSCTGFAHCAATFRPLNRSIPSPYPGEETVGAAQAMASTDPSVLLKHATPPPHWNKTYGLRTQLDPMVVARPSTLPPTWHLPAEFSERNFSTWPPRFRTARAADPRPLVQDVVQTEEADTIPTVRYIG